MHEEEYEFSINTYTPLKQQLLQRKWSLLYVGLYVHGYTYIISNWSASKIH